MHLSSTVASTMLDIDRKKLRRTKRQVASAAFSLHMLARSALEKAIAQIPDAKLEHYIDHEKYDEVSMPIRVAQASVASGGLMNESTDLVAIPSHALSLQMCTIIDNTKEAGTTKIMQSLSHFGMLFSQQTPAGPRFITMIGEALHGLQACNRTTAEVTVEMIRQISACTLAAQHFATRLRMATADHYAATMNAERTIAG